MQTYTQQPTSSHAMGTKFYSSPRPTVAGTACFLAGLFAAYGAYPAEITSTAMASVAANAVGLGLLASLAIDSTQGLRNLFRTDVLCLISIYALTLAEFLFPQDKFDAMSSPSGTSLALSITLVGMAALAIGRHLVPDKPMSSKWLVLKDVSPGTLFKFFMITAIMGYLYKLIAVDFDFLKMIQAMMGARFTQPWGRSRLGGWGSLLIELSLMTFIIPPLTGVIWNRRKNFSIPQLAAVTAVFLVTIFQGFASGTRNVFISYLATFIMAYVLTLRKNTIFNTIVPIFLTGAIAMYGSYHMLEFRDMGLDVYLQERGYEREENRDTLAIDYNLGALGWVAEAMPRDYEFLGMEMVTWSVVRPVPRAIWPSKPEGLSVTIEEIVGAGDGWTVAATYLGEGYMMGGMTGVTLVSLFFGMVASWWNRMAMQRQSDYALVVYALGFFAAGISMRSMLWFTTTIIPVVTLILFRRLLSRRSASS